MVQYYHTKDHSFTTRTAECGEGYYVNGTYWRRPDNLSNKVKVSSTMEILGYKGGGYFGNKEEATLNIEPFRLHI